MKRFKVFIDGSAGTTGLRIHQRLAARQEFTLLTISEEARKNVQARAAVINESDLTFLCLPDAASREVMPLLRPDVKILDTSTAFRTALGWVYGFPELHGVRQALRTACRVAVPGCHASGFISLVRPLVETGLLPADYPLVSHSLTGYSGGGKKMIAQYEDAARPALYSTPCQYGLTLGHKHLPEMAAVCGLSAPPVFCPIVDDYYSGMLVTVPLRMESLPADCEAVAAALAAYYQGEKQVTVHPLGQTPEDGMLAAGTLSGTDRMELFCTARADGSQMLLMSVFDNLGKGSSGAAIQCMNIMLGLPEDAGLE